MMKLPKRCLVATGHVLFGIAIVVLIFLPKNGIFSYTRSGIATIRKGGRPCAICFAPTTPVSYVSIRGRSECNSFCPKHAPYTLKSEHWSWEGNVCFGWIFGAAFPLMLAICGLGSLGSPKQGSTVQLPALPLLGGEVIYVFVYVVTLWTFRA